MLAEIEIRRAHDSSFFFFFTLFPPSLLSLSLSSIFFQFFIPQSTCTSSQAFPTTLRGVLRDFNAFVILLGTRMDGAIIVVTMATLIENFFVRVRKVYAQ